MNDIFERQIAQLFLIACILAILGGCIGGPTETTPETDSISDTGENAGAATATPHLMPDSDPIQTYKIGNESTLPRHVEPHSYNLVNSQFRSESDLNMTVIVRRNGSSVFQRNVTIPPRRSIKIENHVVGNYTIEVNPKERPRRTFTSPWEEWDCNSVWFDMILRPNGSWSTEGGMTLVRCVTATPDTPLTDLNKSRADCETPTASLTVETEIKTLNCETPATAQD